MYSNLRAEKLGKGDVLWTAVCRSECSQLFPFILELDQANHCELKLKQLYLSQVFKSQHVPQPKRKTEVVKNEKEKA